MKYLFPLVLMVSVPIILCSQYSVKGVVSDSTGQPLIAATTVVINPVDSTMITFGITDNYGKFFLSGIPAGKNLLQITYIGYGTFQQEVEASGQNPLINLDKIMLSPDNELLQEVVVKAEHVPIMIKGDTVEYNAAAYKTRKTDAVEDLLKKLPGIEVEQDGNIKIQGEDIDQVLVDGKEFFGDDHRIATKNLPADVVDKVAVYDKKSEEAEFTGIDDGSREKTIDLRLKEDKKNGAFGNVEGGAGTNSRYEGKFNLNRFSSNTQMSLISNLNNVNNVGFSAGNGLEFGERMISIGGASRLGLRGIGNQSGENTTGNAGINFNQDFGKKVKWRSSYNFNYADQFVLEENKSQYFLNNINYINRQENTNGFNQRGHNLRSSLEYDIDSLTEVRIKSIINLQDAKSNIQSLGSNINMQAVEISAANRMDLNRSDNLKIKLDGALRRRLNKEGRILQLMVGLNSAYGDDERNLDNLFSDISQRIQQIQEQIEDENQQVFNGTISFTEPLSKNWLWTTSFSAEKTDHDQSNDFFEMDPINGGVSALNNLSNVYEKQYDFQNYGTNLRYFKGNFNLLWGLSYYHAQLSGTIEETLVNENTFRFLLPRLDLSYELDNGRFGMNYRTLINEPTLNQLQPVMNNQNPLFLYQGNPALRPSYTHLIALSLNKFDSFNFRSWFGYLSLSYTKDHISNSRTIDENLVNRSTPINIDDNVMANGNITYSSPIAFAKFRISARGNYTFTTAIVDNIENDNKRVGGGLTVTLENKKKDNFDLRFSGGFDLVDSRFSIQENFNQKFLNTNLGSSIEVYISDQTIFDTDFRFENYSQEQFSTDNRLYFWNIGLSQTIGESQRLTLSLEGKDLLNTNAGINRNAFAGVVSEVRSTNLGRYFMLKASYAISAFRPKSMFTIQ